MNLRVRYGLVIALACSTGVVSAEDAQLRAQAVAIISRAKIASLIKGGPYNIRTEVTFSTSSADGKAVSGSLNRLKGSKGYLRQSIVWGDYRASMVGVNMQVASVGPWDLEPYAVRRLFSLVPFSVGEFDTKDVVRAIRDGGTSTCVDFETIEGEARATGDICFSKANGTMVEARVGDKTYDYSGYYEIAGARLPGHIEYREQSGFSLTVNIVMTKLDTLSEDAFAFPAGAEVRTLCHRFSEPIPISVPQPSGRDTGTVNKVSVQAEVTAEGVVVNPFVVRSDRPELNAEALKTVQAWRYEPGTCEGKPNQMRIDLEVQFQGR
jgi:TonB family protein